MSDRSERGVLYTEHSGLTANTPLASLWSYDQAHMINEFRAFAGSPPTFFFQPHGGSIDAANIQLIGRPSEWLCRAAQSVVR